jgi:hypothetical protein
MGFDGVSIKKAAVFLLMPVVKFFGLLVFGISEFQAGFFGDFFKQPVGTSIKIVRDNDVITRGE